MLNSVKRLCIAIAFSSGFALQASAEPQGDDFVAMDRLGFRSHVGGEMSYISIGAGTVAFRSVGYGEYVDACLGAGAYFQFPASYFRTIDSSAWAAGDFEIGGLMTRRVGWLGLLFRAGIALPSAPSDPKAEAANTFASPARLTDYYLNIPSGTSLRVAFSQIAQYGKIFSRLDAGVDYNFSNGTETDTGSVLRLNVGAGVNWRNAAIMAEFINLRFNGPGGLWVDNGALSARLNVNGISPYLAFLYPLDRDSRMLFGFAVTAGVAQRWY